MNNYFFNGILQNSKLTMKSNLLTILIVLVGASLVEGKFRMSKPSFRSSRRMSIQNYYKSLKKVQNDCIENIANKSDVSEYFCKRCIDDVEKCTYSNINSVTYNYCMEQIKIHGIENVPYYCVKCDNSILGCKYPKHYTFKRFEREKVFNNCKSYPFDAEECVEFCVRDNLKIGTDFISCSSSTVSWEIFSIVINTVILGIILAIVIMICSL